MNTCEATTNTTCETGESSPNRLRVGGKGYNLIRLKNEKLAVPEFFVLTSSAFMQSLDPNIRSNWDNLSAMQRIAVVQELRLHDDVLVDVLRMIYDLFNPAASLAVRSSAVDEDGNAMSYAGQFASILNVTRNDLASAIESVWRSGFSEQLIAYRTLNGLTSAPEAPCVILQEMVPAKKAGVAFGADPVTGDRSVVLISSVNGLADKLVSGEVDSATYRLKDSSIESKINESIGFLTDDQILQINSLIKKANKIFGSPQDIEWAIDENDQLYILQSRPITTLRPTAEDAKRSSMVIFDNSNIGESYPGVTTPLTFSFARKAYQHVYEEFCRFMGVSEKAIEKHAFIFPRMLGFVRGRIYYNLINWYRLLSLFPGFKTNRGFMEQMMGVKAGLPTEFLAEFDKPLPPGEKLADAISVIKLVPKLIIKWIQLPQDIKTFNHRVESSFQRVPAELGSLSDKELAKLYRDLEKDLLLHWDAPIVNDFFAMVSFGLLRGVCTKWFNEIGGLHNQLLCGETGIISTEPVTRMQKLAEIASSNPGLMELLKTGEVASSNSQLNRYPEFLSLYQSYLATFGDRCTGELKLESPTVVDNPQALLAGILRLAKEQSSIGKNSSNQAQKNRTDAEQLALKSLGHNFVRAFVFNLILSQTRTRIRERENLRFMRTRVFGLVRKIFVEIGKRFETEGLLKTHQDIFYLETEEILGHIEKTERRMASPLQLNAEPRMESHHQSDIETGRVHFETLQLYVEARKCDIERFNSMPAPPDRFSVRDEADLNDAEIDSQIENSQTDAVVGATPCVARSESNATYRGLGCCPGIVRGYARVIDDPNTQHLNPGEILVAKRTDPGWITVIAQATGIVVEYGSLLSHTAIVSRELGIPTIVSVSNVTASVKTGEWLEINGATGEVRVTSSQEVVALAVNKGPKKEVVALHAYAESNKVVAMKSEIQSKAGFSFIRYAQCWEDTDIVLEAMNINPGDKCLSIASAGDNTLALLAKNPGKVVALDLNPAQLALLELKAVAFSYLSYDDMLILLGYRPGDRLRLFKSVETHLTPTSFEYWNQHISDIESGVASTGKFEKYFAMFRKYVLPLVHSESTVDELLQWKSKEQRARFFRTQWNTRKWRAIFKVFFSPIVMGLLGRDPSFFKYAEGGLAEVLLKWTKKALVDQNPANNPYLHWILKGEFGSVLPYFLRKENFEAIKSNIDNLEWYQLSLEEYLSAHPYERFNSFNLSDVFEYVSEENYKSILKLIVKASKSNAKVVYWNMMAPRAAGVEQMQPLTALSKALFAENKTFFYSRFVVEKVRIDESDTSTSACEAIIDTDDNKDRAA